MHYILTLGFVISPQAVAPYFSAISNEENYYSFWKRLYFKQILIIEWLAKSTAF